MHERVFFSIKFNTSVSFSTGNDTFLTSILISNTNQEVKECKINTQSKLQLKFVAIYGDKIVTIDETQSSFHFKQFESYNYPKIVKTTRRRFSTFVFGHTLVS